MADPQVPEEAVEALIHRRVAETFGPQYNTLHGWPKFLRDRPADAVRLREQAEDDVKAVAPAIRKQECERVRRELVSEDALIEAAGELTGYVTRPQDRLPVARRVIESALGPVDD